MALDDYENELALRERRMAVERAAESGNLSDAQRAAMVRSANLKYKTRLAGTQDNPAIKQALELADDAANMRFLGDKGRQLLAAGSKSLYEDTEDAANLELAGENPDQALVGAIQGLRRPSSTYRSGRYSGQALGTLASINSAASGLREKQQDAFNNPMTTAPNKPYSLYSEEDEV